MNRAAMLDKIRNRLKVHGSDATRIQAVEARLSALKPNTVPAETQTDDPLALFEQKLDGLAASFARVGDLMSVPEAITAYLGEGARVCASDEVLALGLKVEPFGISLERFAGKASVDAGLTLAFAGVAETGSLAVVSSLASPLALNFLADRHVALVFADDVVNSTEALWHKVRTAGGMPRDLTLVTGPSCTGDIEMIIEFGAHGPRQLHVILVEARP